MKTIQQKAKKVRQKTIRKSIDDKPRSSTKSAEPMSMDKAWDAVFQQAVKKVLKNPIQKSIDDKPRRSPKNPWVEAAEEVEKKVIKEAFEAYLDRNRKAHQELEDKFSAVWAMMERTTNGDITAHLMPPASVKMTAEPAHDSNSSD